MTDNPGTSSDEPSDIDIGAELEAFEESINQAVRDEHIHRLDSVHLALINAVRRLFQLLERETRRIDNELTQAITTPKP